ncbi:hypothetical protein HYZ99_00980 [Candidatus Peregrinibacteria bacterium]|nr:hypothetical protein [Candidatus Peregrinibacteria bacterium]
MNFFQPLQILFTDDPFVRWAQIGLIVAGFLAIFLVFFATRDIILRTRSFWYQCLAILLVALLPGVGFLLYLLIRPARTLAERDLERKVSELLDQQKTVGGTDVSG